MTGETQSVRGEFDGHRLLALVCNHAERNDDVLCECGWTHTFYAVGQAFDGWLRHAREALARAVQAEPAPQDEAEAFKHFLGDEEWTSDEIDFTQQAFAAGALWQRKRGAEPAGEDSKHDD